ncbi:MAG: hypothetical protein GEU75_06640 [Dehalococcoidia bacterium]|nr:hypothetical protein [Dehalococcoidia bacterium]
MTSDNGPTLADQVTRLYDIIGGYHATNLLEIGRELGVWTTLTRSPGLSSQILAMRLKTDTFYTDVLCRTALAFGLLDREGNGWRMARTSTRSWATRTRPSTWRARRRCT